MSREVLILFGGITLLIGTAFVASRVLRAFRHGFSIRLQLFFAIWVPSMLATAVIGFWVIERLHFHADLLASSRGPSVGIVLDLIREFGPKITLLVVLLSLAAAGAAIAFGRALAAPLESLSRSAEAIAAGHRHVVLPPPSGREVRRLSSAFESMHRSLEDRNYVEQFVADLSHELKNPVSAIRAASEVLSEGAADEPEARSRFLGRIDEATQRLEVLITDLLALARLEAIGVIPDWEDIAFEGLVETAVDTISSELDLQDINVEMDLEDVSIRGDRRWLLRAMDNLLSNALRYSPRGGSISLQLRRDGDRAVLVIRDQGPGVPPHLRDKVFDRFVTDRSKPDQTGLGLAIVQSVFQLHGGEAKLIGSNEERGACFELSLTAL